jgi:indolepyruvate ferredoxin oxidoreductase
LFVDANRLAEGLFGSHLAGNLFLTGVAYQAGLIPIQLASIEKAIEWNGVEAEQNLRVFQWGRKYYQDAAWVEAQLKPKSEETRRPFDRVAELKAYQNEAYARDYTGFLDGIADPQVREVVGRYLYKLMAYKDEYEVARLLTKRDFEEQAREQWEAVESISYNLHPPMLRRFGVMQKITPGAWFRVPLSILAACKSLRGTAFDVFGYAPHRRMERSLIAWYRDLVERSLPFAAENLPLVLEIAALPDQIRGYENIKEQSVAKVKALAEEKLKALSAHTRQPSAAQV